MSCPRASVLLTLCLTLGVGLFVGCQRSGKSTDPSTTPSQEETSSAVDSGEPGKESVPGTAREEPIEPAQPEAEATPQTLMVGDPAPSLSIAKWVKGDPVTAFANGQVYVVEFWATWCGPCRVSMPHISSLQEQYPDEVTFIGISDEDEATVRDFMASQQNEETGKTWDEVVTYAIALDANEETSQAYMRAAGQNGIPTAFVVGKDGHVEWIGHPMSMDETLAKVINGQWDREDARKEFLAQREAQEAMQQLQDAFGAAQRSGDWSEPLQILDGLLAKQPEQSQLMRIKLSVLMAAKMYDEAHVLADELAQQVQENPMALNDIAWNLVTRIPPEYQNHELALRIAKQASSLRQDQDPSILDTVARVYYQQNQLEDAIAWQTKAVEAAPEGDAKQQLQSTLDTYKAELVPPAQELAPEVGEESAGVEESAEEMEAEEAAEEAAEQAEEESSIEDTEVEEPAEEEADVDADEEEAEDEAVEEAEEEIEDSSPAENVEENGAATEQ